MEILRIGGQVGPYWWPAERNSCASQTSICATAVNGVRSESQANLAMRGGTRIEDVLRGLILRFQAGVIAQDQRLVMREASVRANEIGLVIPAVSQRSGWQAARVYELGTATDPGGNALIENVD